MDHHSWVTMEAVIIDKGLARGSRLGLGILLGVILSGLIFSSPAYGNGGSDKLVLAFYYPWYRTVESSGFCTWNFGGFKYEERDDACRENMNSYHIPVGGLYDSLEPEVIRRHLDESRRAGIDGWIVSWWGIGDDTDVLDLIMSEAAGHAPGFKITIYYERIIGCRGYVCTESSRKERIETVLKDFRYLHSRYFSHPTYLESYGRPVVFIYMRAMLQGAGLWPEMIRRLRSEMDVFLSADAILTSAVPLVPGGFDQAHFYNQVYELKAFGPGLDYRVFTGSARLKGMGAAITVLPGYDERLVPGRPGIALGRKDGDTYRRVWESALRSDPDWILITSFNEWYEASEIEPSEEFGSLYLDLTRQYSDKFKGN